MNEKIVLIAGKNHEINSALASHFVPQNFKIAYCIDEKDPFSYQKPENSTDILVFRCDFASEEEIRKMKDQVLHSFGKVDYLVFTQKEQLQESFLNIEEEEWDAIYQIALQDYFFLVKVFTEWMIAEKIAGKVICISNTSSIVPREKISCYASAFTAQGLLDSSLALELGAKNISVNSICINSKDQFEVYELNSIPHNQELTTFVSDENLANIILSLFSSAWNAVTGKKIIVDSGEILGDLN